MLNGCSAIYTKYANKMDYVVRMGHLGLETIAITENDNYNNDQKIPYACPEVT